MCKACGGADKRCGGEADLRLSLVGTAPACPGIGTCDPTIAGIADAVACFECTAAVRGDCALKGAAPGAADYPADCAVVPPTPTPTVTPEPSETPRPSETPKASPTLSPTPTPTPLPVFCTAAAPGSATTTATITLATGGKPLSGVDLVLHYEPHLVRLPGVEDDAEVRARIVDLTAGQILNKGAPNNQDGDGDREPDRLRFTVVASTGGVMGDVLTVTFDRCSGARVTTVDDYVCAASGGRALDNLVTPVAVTCTLGLAQGMP